MLQNIFSHKKFPIDVHIKNGTETTVIGRNY